jgi:hypothetical protein
MEFYPERVRKAFPDIPAERVRTLLQSELARTFPGPNVGSEQAA